ncbi:MAG: AmmeMemoRadiSam system radical SAM enzyme [Bacteroidetes bacterium GWA2_31_9b]|nr:MAG: AmmeMemoRadiSam system radical SAM enzyme [Bacteroidetes bacterium GWA2_31_9b]
MESHYYIKLPDNKTQCILCPHMCIISDSNSGICKVRTNQNGILISDNYGVISSIGFDPIEKKPLYHFYPGKEILSVGSFGCNLKCQFCQNCNISQVSVDTYSKEHNNYSSEQILKLALSRKNNIGLAFTYNEPTVFFEFILETARLIKSNGFKNIMVTNGYINLAPLNELHSYIDAYNVDLKAFNNKFFKKITKSTLEPVKETLKSIVKANKHLEITNLVIPTLNDNPLEFEHMCTWIANELGNNTVLHISRYFPTYKITIESTPVEKMLELYEIAKKHLQYVYIGNILLSEGNDTYCNSCKELLIKRIGYSTQIISLDEKGNCTNCNQKILNYFN